MKNTHRGTLAAAVGILAGMVTAVVVGVAGVGTANAQPQFNLPDGSCWEWQGQRIDALFVPCPQPVIPPLPDLSNVPDDGVPNIPHGGNGSPASPETTSPETTAPPAWTPPKKAEPTETEPTETEPSTPDTDTPETPGGNDGADDGGSVPTV